MSDTITGIIETSVTKQDLINCLPCGYCDIAAAIMDISGEMHEQLNVKLSALRKQARACVKSAEEDDFEDTLEDWDDLDAQEMARMDERIEGLLKSNNDFVYTTRMKLELLHSMLFDIDNELLHLPTLFNSIRNYIKDTRRIIKETK